MSDEQTTPTQETFSLDEFVQGRGFPEADVTVFTNADAGYEYSKAQERMKELADERIVLGEATRSKRYKENKAEYDEIEAKAEALKEQVKASALTFHLRGIAPGHIKKITADVQREQEKRLEDEDPWSEQEASDALTHRWFAPHIIRVTKADGAVNSGPFTQDTIAALEFSLPPSQFKKLNDKISDLSFQSAYFDRMVDAGFLPKS